MAAYNTLISAFFKIPGMRKLLMCLVILLIALSGFSQRSAIDSLLALDYKVEDSTRVLRWIKISELYRNYNNDTSERYAKLALDLSRKHSYIYGESIAHNALGFNYYVAGNYPEALGEFKKYRELALFLNDHINSASAINNLGNVEIEMGNYSHALGYYIEALGERKKTGEKKGIAQSYNNIGYLYKEIGDYDKAIENIFTSLRIYDELKDEYGISYCYTFLGIVYGLKHDFSNALKYHNLALTIEQRRNDHPAEAISLQSIATINAEQNQFDLAIENYKKAAGIYNSIGDKRELASIAESMGLLYYKKPDYSQALNLFKESLSINRSIANTRGLGPNYTNIGNCYLHLNDLSKASLFLDSAKGYAIKTGKKEDQKNLYKSLSELYSLNGDYKNAFNNFKLYNAIKDSLFNIENSKSIAGIETKYETEKKERQIEEQKFELVKKNYWIGGILLLLILGSLLVLSNYRRLKLKQQRTLQTVILKQQDMATKSILEAEENERKRIAGDLHDGVGQLMSAAKMNLSGFESRLNLQKESDKIEFGKIIALVDESCKEVRNVSHNMMPNALLKRGLSSAVKEFIDKIDSHILKVNLYSEGLNERLDGNVEMVLYRVIQECVNNVIKHAEANVLDISLIRDTDGIAVTIEDNGKGFNKEQSQKGDGIGLKNIIARVGYLKGSVDFDSSPGNGTLVAIHVPLSQ